MDVKNEMIKATKGGSQGTTSMPAVSKYMAPPVHMVIFLYKHENINKRVIENYHIRYLPSRNLKGMIVS